MGHKTALQLHAYSVLYAHKPTTSRRALGKSTDSQGFDLEQEAACHPPDPHWLFFFPGGGDSRSSGQRVSFS